MTLRRVLISLLTIGANLASCSEASATQVSPTPPKKIFARAGYVFAGTATSVRDWGGTIVFTDLNVIKGPARPDSLVLTLDTTWGQLFTVDQRYIVFASQDLGSTGEHLPVIGLEQGCYSVKKDSTVWSATGLPVVDLTPDMVTVAVPDSTRAIPKGMPEAFYLDLENQHVGPLRAIPERQTLGKRLREGEFLEIVRKFSESSEEPR